MHRTKQIENSNLANSTLDNAADARLQAVEHLMRVKGNSTHLLDASWKTLFGINQAAGYAGGHDF